MFFVRSLLSLDILTPEGFHSLEDAGFPGNSSLELARETQHWVICSLPLAIPSMYKECTKVQPHLRRSASQTAPGPASWCPSPSEVFPSHLGSADLSKQWDITAAWLLRVHLTSHTANSWVNLYTCSSSLVEETVANRHGSEPPWKWYCNCCLPNFRLLEPQVTAMLKPRERLWGEATSWISLKGLCTRNCMKQWTLVILRS